MVAKPKCLFVIVLFYSFSPPFHMQKEAEQAKKETDNAMDIEENGAQEQTAA